MADAASGTKQLSAFDIGCIAVSGILGVGIFFTPHRVALAVDAPGHALLAWVLGGVVALVGAFVFAALARRVPGHGGTFSFVHAAFGPLPAFLYGWANWLVIQSGALVVIGAVMVDYAGVLCFGEVPAAGSLRAIVTILAILVFTATNAAGLRLGSGVQNTLTVLKTGAVFALVLLGFVVASGLVASSSAAASAAATVTPPTPPPAGRGLFLGLLAAMLPVMFSYGGWQQGSFVAGVARHPRAVAVGIVGGVVVVVLAYVSVNVAFFALLGFDGARATATIGASAARAALEPFGHGALAERVFAGMVVASSLGIMNTICLAPPFVLHAMAKQGLFLPSVANLHATRRVPVVGVLVQGLWAALLCAVTQFAFALDLGFLLDGVVFVDWIFYALCGAALLRLRARGAAALSGLVFTVVAAAIALGAIWVNPSASLAGLAVLALGCLVFSAMRRGAGRPRLDS
ncbi:MAG: amino acid permease [Planctomycetes bacterium]|nr:amino acid permease [Planctomycetota bacterium]